MMACRRAWNSAAGKSSVKIGVSCAAAGPPAETSKSGTRKSRESMAFRDCTEAREPPTSGELVTKRSLRAHVPHPDRAAVP